MLPFHQEWNHFWVCPIANQSPYDCRDTHHSTACVFWKETHRESWEYSKTSEQRKHWGKYKFSCCVCCREVVLFSEVQLFRTLKMSCVERSTYYIPISENPLYWRFYCTAYCWMKQWAIRRLYNNEQVIRLHTYISVDIIMLWCKGGSRKQSRSC